MSLDLSYEVGGPHFFHFHFKNLLHRFLDVALARVWTHLKSYDPSVTQFLFESTFFRNMRITQDVVKSTLAIGLARIAMSDSTLNALTSLRAFLFERVYRNEVSVREFRKAEHVLTRIHEYVLSNPVKILEQGPQNASHRERLAIDFIAGMTDRYAIALFEQIAIPRPWVGLR